MQIMPGHGGQRPQLARGEIGSDFVRCRQNIVSTNNKIYTLADRFCARYRHEQIIVGACICKIEWKGGRRKKERKIKCYYMLHHQI